MKIALGMIIRSFESEEIVLNFINNAKKYGHKIDCVIIAYTHNLCPEAADNLKKEVSFYPIDIKKPIFCKRQLAEHGMSVDDIHTLLESPVDTMRGLVPYGFNRNVVMIEAILRGMDVLFFIDSDIYPRLLVKTHDGYMLQEEDFFGAHLKHLREGAIITTSEYSGYNILPHAKFDGMENLLVGLQKSDMLQYWQTSETHRCLSTQRAKRKPQKCSKILGGNVAVTLSAFKQLPPFYSTTHFVSGRMFLGRGEDTVLGLSVAKLGISCVDIDMHPLHDTYGRYTTEPDLKNDPIVQDRFFFACTGWIGRNPYLNYVKGENTSEIRGFQRPHLEKGLRALSEYTSNPKFLGVLKNFDASWSSLERYIREYNHLLKAWESFTERVL